MLFQRTQLLQPIIVRRSRELRRQVRPDEWFQAQVQQRDQNAASADDVRGLQLAAALVHIGSNGMQQGALFVQVGQRTGILFNQHFMSVCRQAAGNSGAVVQPVLETCVVPGAGSVRMRWFRTGSTQRTLQYLVWMVRSLV